MAHNFKDNTYFNTLNSKIIYRKMEVLIPTQKLLNILLLF